MAVDPLFAFADKLGPEKIVHLSRAGAGLKAIVTVDNTACGPAIGGIRMAPDVGAEVRQLGGLPTGVAAALSGSTGATVQLLGSNATACVSVTLPAVVKDEGNRFKAKR